MGFGLLGHSRCLLLDCVFLLNQKLVLAIMEHYKHIFFDSAICCGHTSVNLGNIFMIRTVYYHTLYGSS